MDWWKQQLRILVSERERVMEGTREWTSLLYTYYILYTHFNHIKISFNLWVRIKYIYLIYIHEWKEEETTNQMMMTTTTTVMNTSPREGKSSGSNDIYYMNFNPKGNKCIWKTQIYFIICRWYFMYMIITDLFDIDIHIFTVIKFLFNLVVKFKYIMRYITQHKKVFFFIHSYHVYKNVNEVIILVHMYSRTCNIIHPN